jgi:hypothetical protein
MGWRHVAGIWLLVAGAPLVWCANGSEDSGGDADVVGVDPDANLTEGGTDGGSAIDTGSTSVVDSSTPDTANTTDSGGGPVDSSVTDSATGVDSQQGVDSAVVDTGIPDVLIPDVNVPPGTMICNYLGSAGDFAQYVAECLIFKSSATACASGCAAGSCCGAICENSSNQAVCLPQ